MPDPSISRTNDGSSLEVEGATTAGDLEGKGQVMHLLTIEMGNFCGVPTNSPGGGRATSVIMAVTCEDCIDAFARAVHETAELQRIGDTSVKSAQL